MSEEELMRKLTDEQKRALEVHEAIHVALGALPRRNAAGQIVEPPKRDEWVNWKWPRNKGK